MFCDADTDTYVTEQVSIANVSCPSARFPEWPLGAF
jgi:hypothetical protein